MSNNLNMEDILDHLRSAFTPLDRLGEVELAAIWYERTIQTSTERTPRLTTGHCIRVDGDKLSDVSESHPATHRIVGCHGTITSSRLSLVLVSLDENTPFILRIN